MKDKLREYIANNLEFQYMSRSSSIFNVFFPKDACFEEEETIEYQSSEVFSKRSKIQSETSNVNISDFINNNQTESKFQHLLFKYIDDRDLKDSDVYNKVHIDRRLFSKIRSNPDYHPSKETVILLGLALQLNEDEIIDLLDSASYSLPKNNHYDLIIRFCFIEGIYELKDVNELLSTYDCKEFSY